MQQKFLKEVKHGNLQTVEEMFLEVEEGTLEPFKLNITDSKEESPIQVAIREKNVQMTELLLLNGV